MELEDLKAAWLREIANDPDEEDLKAMMDKARERATKSERDFSRKQRSQILYGLVCLGIMATYYRREGPLLENAGLILMLLCMALMLAGSIILKYRLHESHPELPYRQFLAEERKKICARIALLQRNTRWFFIPCMLGLAAWRIAPAHSLGMAITLAGVAVASVAAWGFYRWKMRKELTPMLEEIDRDIQEWTIISEECEGAEQGR
jgi:hypothetical protein